MTNQALTRHPLIAPVVAAAVCVALAGSARADRGAAEDGRQLRVCGDPNNMPFSNEKLEGVENKIAEVIAKDLGETVTYFWWPHQRGLVKRVLNAKHCDVMLGIPKGYDLVLWTKPYYRTGYVMVYRKDRKLRLRSLDEPALKTLKIGVLVNTPPHEALGKRGIADNVVGYQLMFDSNVHAEDYPGKVVEDVVAGTVDVGMVWGPIAGYFVKKKGAPLEIVPIDDGPDSALPFAFEISMGVRKGDKELKQQLETALARRHAEIERVLADFGVPLLPAAEEKAHDKAAR